MISRVFQPHCGRKAGERMPEIYVERRARAICPPRAQETRPGPEMKDVTGAARRGEATVRTHVPNEILTTRAVQIYIYAGARNRSTALSDSKRDSRLLIKQGQIFDATEKVMGGKKKENPTSIAIKSRTVLVAISYGDENVSLRPSIT